ncbi:DUF1876 domain-containing protein [Salininema proteolyticum]|uniref:DUF1876 domain-containing protein n=1 Tax=Salininema proteolyticum TaxID=1607685 RepID=A0ABV8TSG6_9ACTN
MTTAAIHWDVDVDIEENQDSTVATATLHQGEATVLKRRGRARRNPDDRPMPEIGEELACARALSDLGHALMSEASKDVEFNVRRGDPEEGLNRSVYLEP